ncbi:tail fiber/spike domain-containing protein, partial [Klebsiella pneumoniae]
GLDGVANRPLKSLANRTRYLKEAADESDKLIAEKVSAVKTFDEGATLESPREEIMYGAYRLVWTGKFPKTVLAGSTPQSTGGVGAGCWAYTSDAVIRQTMISADGFKLIGQVPSYASLKNIIPERPGQRVLLAAYHPGGKTGGGEFIAVSGVAPDDGGTICVPAGQANWYWKRVNIASYDVTWFGAVASDDTATYTAANTVSIQNALNAAEKAGLAAVWFPVAETFYPCGTIYVPAGVSLMGSRTKALFGATVYLRSSSNIVVSQLFKDIWCKRSFFRLWDPNAVNAQISNIRFSNCFIDGTSLTGGGKATGHAIQVRNPVFDVHFDRTYVWNYTGNGFDMVVDNAATPIPYLATGVFTTFSDGKIF